MNRDKPVVMDDEYHRHYVSADKDYYHYLMDNAHLIANPFRLQMHIYSEADEERCRIVWEESKALQQFRAKK